MPSSSTGQSYQERVIRSNFKEAFGRLRRMGYDSEANFISTFWADALDTDRQLMIRDFAQDKDTRNKIYVHVMQTKDSGIIWEVANALEDTAVCLIQAGRVKESAIFRDCAQRVDHWAHNLLACGQ